MKSIKIKSKDKRLKSFIERIERLEEEKSNIPSNIRAVYFEAKILGYKLKIMNWVLAIRKIDIDERLEQDTLLDTYKNALGMI